MQIHIKWKLIWWIYFTKMYPTQYLSSRMLLTFLQSRMFNSLSLIHFITASITTWVEYRAAKKAFPIERSPVLIVTGQLELAFSTALPRQHSWTAWVGSHSNWFQSCVANKGMPKHEPCCISSEMYTYLSVVNTYQTVCVKVDFLAINVFIECMLYTNNIHIVIRIALNNNNTYLLWR